MKLRKALEVVPSPPPPDTEIFNQWALEQKAKKDGAQRPQDKTFAPAIGDYESGYAGPGLDHTFYARWFPEWAPEEWCDALRYSRCGLPETVLVTTPYEPIPSFDPGQLLVLEAPVSFHGGAKSYICALRNPLPNGRVWKWFTAPLKWGPMPFKVLPELLSEGSKYGVGVTMDSQGLDPVVYMFRDPRRAKERRQRADQLRKYRRDPHHFPWE